MASGHGDKGRCRRDQVAPLSFNRYYTTPCQRVTVSPCHLNFNRGEALKRSAINPSLSASFNLGDKLASGHGDKGRCCRDAVAPLPSTNQSIFYFIRKIVCDEQCGHLLSTTGCVPRTTPAAINAAKHFRV